MADVAMIDYNDTHRAFVQAFFARNTMTLESAKPVLANIFSVQEGREVLTGDVTLEDLTSYVSAANTELSSFDLEIRSSFHQRTRERFWALINTTSDPLTQLATSYTADEIVFVKKLLDAMFDGSANKGRKEAMCLSAMDAMQVARTANRRETQDGAAQPARQTLSLKEAEDMLAKLVSEGWLEKSIAGFYTLTPRALMELKGWLVDTYNEPGDEEHDVRRDKIKFCNACKEIITVGQRCSKRECSCRLHDICTQNFFRMQRSNVCPLCKTAWDGKSYVGEKAITSSESYQTGKRRNTNRQLSPEPEEEEEEDQEQGSIRG